MRDATYSKDKFAELGLNIKINKSHPMVKHLHHSAEESRYHRSKLSNEIIALPGMSNDKVRHFMNNLGMMMDLKYLEIGTHTGSTAISFGYKNPVLLMTCVDNYSMAPEAEHNFKRNIQMHKKYLPKFDIWKRDCWEIDLNSLGIYDVLFYDGDHSFESQFRAICHFWPVLRSTFFLVVDDFNTLPACAGTMLGLNQMQATVLGVSMLPGIQLKGKIPPQWGWWNGLFAAVIEK